MLGTRESFLPKHLRGVTGQVKVSKLIIVKYQLIVISTISRGPLLTLSLMACE